MTPAPPDGPALLVVGNVFFSARLRDMLKHLDIVSVTARTPNDIEATLEASMPAVVIIELATPTIDAVELVRRIKSDDRTRAVPVIAFGGHLDVEQLEAAAQAGADRAVTNGQISSGLPAILSGLGVH